MGNFVACKLLLWYIFERMYCSGLPNTTYIALLCCSICTAFSLPVRLSVCLVPSRERKDL